MARFDGVIFWNFRSWVDELWSITYYLGNKSKRSVNNHKIQEHLGQSKIIIPWQASSLSVPISPSHQILDFPSPLIEWGYHIFLQALGLCETLQTNQNETREKCEMLPSAHPSSHIQVCEPCISTWSMEAWIHSEDQLSNKNTPTFVSNKLERWLQFSP